MMKRYTLLLVLFIFAFLPIDVSASKISASSKSLSPGQTYTIKVSGTKKKVKWSSSNKKVATVSSKGKVKAKKVGKATITASFGKKKLKCKITVKIPKDSVSSSKIKYELEDIDTGVIMFATNNNSLPVDLSYSRIGYYDPDGVLIDSCYVIGGGDCVGPGESTALFFPGPTDSDYNPVYYSDFYLNMNVEKSIHISLCEKVDTNSSLANSQLNTEVQNNSNKYIDSFYIFVVFYDSDYNAIGCDFRLSHCSEPGANDYLSFQFPDVYNWKTFSYDTVEPYAYEVYVNDAY